VLVLELGEAREDFLYVDDIAVDARGFFLVFPEIGGRLLLLQLI
jgi:hypothetical protein